MPILTGYIAQAFDGAFLSGRISTDLLSIDAMKPPYSQALASSPPGAAAPIRTLAKALARAISGAVTPSYFDDYYNRIHVTPTSLDLGNLLTVQTRDVDVWNSYVDSITLDTAQVPSGQGVLVSSPVPVPTTYAPLQQITYTVTVGLSGPPTIDTAFTLSFGGVTVTMPITGNRVVVFPFSPDWANNVFETLQYKTSISRSRNKTEQRMALRKRPRRIYQYNATILDAQEAAQFDQLVFGWDGRYFALPMWPERAYLNAEALAGATTISVDTTNRTFVAGGLIVLFKDTRTFEAAEIAGVSGSTITLVRGLQSAWQINTYVYPTGLALIDAEFTASRVTDSYTQTQVQFTMDPQTVDPRTPTVAAAATYLGEELYAVGTDWRNGVAFQVTSDRLNVDSDVGIFKPFQKSGWPDIVKPHRWVLKTADEITAMRAWAARRNGRQKAVWMPTGTTDLTLLTTIASNGTVFSVTNQGYAVYGGQDERKHIGILLNDGTFFARQITDSSGLSDDTQQLVIDSSLGRTVQPTDVRRISFLGLFRLSSDDVTFAWNTVSVATLDLNLQLTRPA